MLLLDPKASVPFLVYNKFNLMLWFSALMPSRNTLLSSYSTSLTIDFIDDCFPKNSIALFECVYKVHLCACTCVRREWRRQQTSWLLAPIALCFLSADVILTVASSSCHSGLYPGSVRTLSIRKTPQWGWEEQVQGADRKLIWWGVDRGEAG